MNNEKQQLLQNPLVKEIALDFYHTKVEDGWDDFVNEQIELNKPSLSVNDILKTKAVNWDSPLGRELKQELINLANC